MRRVRTDENDDILPAFDPALATVTAWGRHRQEALARLSRVLTESAVLIRGGMSTKPFRLCCKNARGGHDGRETSLLAQLRLPLQTGGR